MYEVLAIGPMLAAGVLYVLLVPFGLMYVLGDVHGRRAGSRDPALGAKVVATLLLTVCFQAILAGLTLLLTNVLNDGPSRVNETAFGVIIGSALAGILPLVLYASRVKEAEGENIARKAVGMNAIICGLVMVLSVIGLFVALFSGADVTLLIPVVIIYFGGALLTMLALMRKPTPSGGTGSGTLPAEAPPVAQPPRG